MTKLYTAAGLAFLVALVVTPPARAQLLVNVSVKLFYDDTVDPPIPPGGDVNPVDGVEDVDHCGNLLDNSALSCDPEIIDKIDYVNTVLDRMGRGYRFNLVDIVHLEDPPDPPEGLGDSWTWANHGNPGQNALDSERMADPEAFAWRDDALNFYVFNGGGGYADTETNKSSNKPLMTSGGTRGAWTRFLHEAGHHLGLSHTFRGPCPDVCDGVCDTVVDLEGGTIDEVAVKAFGDVLQNLSCEDQEAVFDVFFNIMSYHADDDHCDDCRLSDPDLVKCDNYAEESTNPGCTSLKNRQCRVRLTDDQLDQITVRLNNLVSDVVVSGRTVFVTQNPNPHCTSTFPPAANTCPCDMAPRNTSGSNVAPYATVAAGLADTGADGAHDVLLIRSGSFSEVLTINQPVTLRATRGTVNIGI